MKFSAEGELECCHYVVIFTTSIHCTSTSILNIKDHGTSKSVDLQKSQLQQFLSAKR